MIYMLENMLLALVKSAQSIKMAQASVVVSQDVESQEFFDALSDYNDFFCEVHNDLSEILRPLIHDDDPRIWSMGCALLEKYFNLFRTPVTEAEKTASEYCLKYKI